MGAGLNFGTGSVLRSSRFHVYVSYESQSETAEEEDPLPPEFLRSIEPDVFEDFGNTSRYFY